MILDMRLNSLKKTGFDKTLLFVKYIPNFSVRIELKCVTVSKEDPLKKY